jgi:hypothetical protein
MPSPQGVNAMTNKIAEIAVLTAAFVLCSSSLAPAYPRHGHHVRGASVRKIPATPVHRGYGALVYQGRSIAPSFTIPPPEYEYQQYRHYQSEPPCTSLDDCDRKDFDESGTRGRMGLGADPAHPEGPGNVSD